MVSHTQKNGIDDRVDYVSLKDVFESSFDHEYSLNWFDNEIKKFSSIDIFEHPWCEKKGYQCYKKGKYEILVIDMKKLNSLESVVSKFTGHEVKLSKLNTARDKWYYPLIDEFKKAKLDENLVAVYENSKIVRKFYDH